ncbi:MAG: hypothetical protein DCF15_13590 [Phormidesmis priestleyi]|uniref:Uncharacterized protein n=1 Tax=Phormidesmis priestleyi TaxID=268141 RepID=A0A2W4X6L4_9CYAN|nr:MAG: hypothetical protein DCF15_13590 [Phormidesmis priestleyi]
MSSYLEHLVGRSQGDANQVKPLLPTLFEPSPKIGDLDQPTLGRPSAFGMVASLEQSDAEMQSRQPLQVQDVERPTRSQQRFPSPSFGGQAEPYPTNAFLATNPQGDEAQPQVFTQPAESSDNLSLVDLLTRRPQPPILQRRVDTVPYASSPSNLSGYPDGVEAMRGNVPVPVVRLNQPEEQTTLKDLVIAPAAPMPAPVSAHAALDIRPAIESVSSTPVAPSVGEPTMIRSAGVMVSTNPLLASPSIRSLLAEPVEPLPKVSSAPTINVTIGRIEVRAMPLASAQAKPRSASSVMSLNEYLRKRGGGT